MDDLTELRQQLAADLANVDRAIGQTTEMNNNYFRLLGQEQGVRRALLLVDRALADY